MLSWEVDEFCISVRDSDVEASTSLSGPAVRPHGGSRALSPTP